MKLKLTVLFCFLASFTFAQSLSDLPPNAEPGKCYAKCLVKEAYGEHEIEVPVYTGDPNDKSVKRSKKTFVITEESTKWAKMKSPNCKSIYREDCLVWTLVKIPGITEERIVVENPSKISDYEMEVFTIKDRNRNNVAIEWREVLCEKDVNENTVIQIQEALIKRGYLKSVNFEDKRFDKESLAGLKKLQRENGFPVGNLDFETLDFLEIDY